jgi:LacI family transcriptional regulator
MIISLRDIAKKAGVSVGTASNVLNRPGIVAAETAKRVHQVMEEMGYNPNGYVKQMSAGHSRTLGLVVPNVSNPFFAEVARGVEDAAAKKNYAVFLCNSGESNQREERFMSVLIEQMVRGVLITPTSIKPAHVKLLKERGISVTLIDSLGKSSTECSVSVNDVRGGEIAIEHLVDYGHKNIAWVSGPQTIPQAADRSRGVSAAAKSLKVNVTHVSTHGMTFAAGEDSVSQILALSPRPTAIFCGNDLLALGVMRGLMKSGVRIPDEISIIGYDDIEFAPSAAVPLTSIAQPAYQLGFTATNLLLSECEGVDSHAHQDVRFQPELVVRSSTRDMTDERAQTVVKREYDLIATSYFGSKNSDSKRSANTSF